MNSHRLRNSVTQYIGNHCKDQTFSMIRLWRVVRPRVDSNKEPKVPFLDVIGHQSHAKWPHPPMWSSLHYTQWSIDGLFQTHNTIDNSVVPQLSLHMCSWLPYSTYLYLDFHDKAKRTQQGNLNLPSHFDPCVSSVYLLELIQVLVTPH